jgi:hypothetical protein
LKVADWDTEPFSPEALRDLLSAVCFVNQQTNFHLVIFCEWHSYPAYEHVVEDTFGPRICHRGPLVFLKQAYGRGQDLANTAEVALYVRIGTKMANFLAKPDRNNVFGSVKEGITFLKDWNNQVLNPAQKPYKAIKQLLAVYTTPGEMVLDIFAGTGQVARAAVKIS